jgi:hypothetical protein
VAVDGSDAVSVLSFEALNGRQFNIGEREEGQTRWNTANANGDCLTGIYGVYQLVDAEQDVRKLLSIGFYFGQTSEGPIEEVKTYSAELFIKIVAAIMGVGLIGCLFVVSYLSCARSE